MSDDDTCARKVDGEIFIFLSELPPSLQSIYAEIGVPTVSWEQPPSDVLAHLARNSSLITSSLFRFVRVSAQVTFPKFRSEDPDLTPSMQAAFEDADAGYYLARALELSLQLSELSNPGCIWCADGVATVDGQIVAEIEKKHFFGQFHPGFSTNRSWPSVTEIPLSVVVHWALATGLLRSPLAVTRLQRILATYTHVVGLSFRHDGEILFRAMQGLEAFYCDGVGDLRRQLAEKINLWLGPSGDKTNVVGQLYDLRSQYIHGSAKLQYWHDIGDPWTEDPKMMDRFSEGVEFAVRLLVATIQKCIIASASDVTWSFTHAVTHIEAPDG